MEPHSLMIARTDTGCGRLREVRAPASALRGSMSTIRCQAHTLRNNLLAALPLEDQERLRPRLQAFELRFEQTLHPPEGPVDAVLFPETGIVSFIAALDDGSRIEVGIAGRRGLVGLPLVFGDDRSLVEARVQMKGGALRIGATAFRAAMAESAALRKLLLRYALAFPAQLTLTAACNARHPIEQRLARWLLIAHDRAAATSSR